MLTGSRTAGPTDGQSLPFRPSQEGYTATIVIGSVRMLLVVIGEELEIAGDGSDSIPDGGYKI